MGLVSEVFSEEELAGLNGFSAIGHVRYSTAGKSSLVNAQPFSSHLRFGHTALAHNGNISNAGKLRRKMISEGAIFGTDSDSEILLHLIQKNKSEKFEDALKESLNVLEGAF